MKEEQLNPTAETNHVKRTRAGTELIEKARELIAKGIGQEATVLATGIGVSTYWRLKKEHADQQSGTKPAPEKKPAATEKKFVDYDPPKQQQPEPVGKQVKTQTFSSLQKAFLMNLGPIAVDDIEGIIAEAVDKWLEPAGIERVVIVIKTPKKEAK